MSSEQLHFIYGPSSPFNDTVSLDRLKGVISSNASNLMDIDGLIRADLRKLAKADEIKIRRKRDIVLTPITFVVIGPGICEFRFHFHGDSSFSRQRTGNIVVSVWVVVSVFNVETNAICSTSQSSNNSRTSGVISLVSRCFAWWKFQFWLQRFRSVGRYQFNPNYSRPC